MLVSQVENLDRPWKLPIFSNAFKNTSCVASWASSMFPRSPARVPNIRRECRRTNSSNTSMSPSRTRATRTKSGSSGSVLSGMRRALSEERYKSFRPKTLRGGKSGAAPTPACNVLRKLPNPATTTASTMCCSVKPWVRRRSGSNRWPDPPDWVASLRHSSSNVRSFSASPLCR